MELISAVILGCSRFLIFNASICRSKINGRKNAKYAGKSGGVGLLYTP